MDMISNTKCEICGAEKERKEYNICGDTKIMYFPTCECEYKKQTDKDLINRRIDKRKILKNRYMSAKFTRKQRGKRLSRLSGEYITEAKYFIDSFKPRSSKGLFFIGKTGNGKTTLANCIAKELLIKDYKVISMGFAEYLNKMQQTYSPKSETSFDDLLDKWTNYDLLVIDDFGREKYTDKRLENVFLFFDKLYNNCTTYIITANPESIARVKEIPEFNAIFDRLSEQTDKLIFNNKSYRRENN